MLPHHVILSIFTALISQGRVASAMPLGSFETFGQKIHGRDLATEVKLLKRSGKLTTYPDLSLDSRAAPALPTSSFVTKYAGKSYEAICELDTTEFATRLDAISQQLGSLQQYNDHTTQAAKGFWPLVTKYLLSSITFAAYVISVGTFFYMFFKPFRKAVDSVTVKGLKGKGLEPFCKAINDEFDKKRSDAEKHNKDCQTFYEQNRRTNRHITWPKLLPTDEDHPDIQGKEQGPYQLYDMDAITKINLIKGVAIGLDAWVTDLEEEAKATQPKKSKTQKVKDLGKTALQVVGKVFRGLLGKEPKGNLWEMATRGQEPPNEP